MKEVELVPGNYGRRAIVKGAGWRPALTKYLKEGEILELELNDGKGWRGDDLGFLREFPELKQIIIIDFNIRSISPVHSLHELRALTVSTYCSTPISFSEFPHLESCAIEWRKGSESLFECVTLRDLFVNRYKLAESGAFGRLINLERLAILNAPIRHLDGLSPLQRLRALRIANLRKLRGIGGIGTLLQLRELDINTCRGVHGLDEIGRLSLLERLLLNNVGPVRSLAPLRNLTRLKEVIFYDSTDILDGDLSPLVRSPPLKTVAFRERPHYSHTRRTITAGGDR